MAVRRFLGLMTAVALVCGVASAPSARAATVISVVASGTVTDSDGGQFNGETVTIEQRFVVNPSTVFPDPSFAVALFDSVRVSVTIGGSTDVFDSATAVSASGAYTISALDVPNSVPAGLNASSLIEFAPGFFVSVIAQIGSATDAFVPSTDLFQDFAFPPLPSEATISLALSVQDSEGNELLFVLAERGDALSVTVREIVGVPAPAAFGLFAAGLVGLIAVRRHRLPTA